MTHSRRKFLKGAGAAGIAVIAGTSVQSATAKTLAKAPDGAKKATNGELPKQMSFCTLRKGSEYTLGIKTTQGILDVKRTAAALRRNVPTTIEQVLQGETQGLKALADEATKDKSKAVFIAEDQAQFGPCVTNPEKIIMLGHNYMKHVLEVKAPVPSSPVFFNKYNNALNGHNGTVPLPTVAKKFDYEVELVVVMGKLAKNVSEADALSYVFGYCVGNDFTARDLQYKTSQYLLGKTPDGFGPIGPYLVTADQIPNPNNLTLECRVNGEVRQSANTSDMIFNVPKIISYASQHFTLKPGDIFFTGTPSGVIAGYPPEKQVWLKAGDEVITTIEKLGRQRFTLTQGQA
jgi:2-keto-4-pentenoate hydratase/2-oxohepta-3-ene-1,7-dioic acid hydratase in catechol pathway